jgi:predicted regulator of Ras-like GTPase activity (Roadblock/LC7/MglB family)
MKQEDRVIKQDIGSEEQNERQEQKEEIRASNWLTKIDNARQFEINYRQDAYNAIMRYRGEKTRYAGYKQATRTLHGRIPREFSTRLNIFYSNIETLNSIICPVIPQIIVQKKPAKQDVMNLQERKFYTLCCEAMEKLLTYYIDNISMRDYQKFKYDWLITGRGVLWVTYRDLEERGTIKKSISIERVAWNDYAQDPKTQWADVKWVARRFYLNRGEFRTNFPDIPIKDVSFANYKNLLDYENDGIDFNLNATGDKFTEVWELWDKDTKHAMFLSRYYGKKMLKYIHVPEIREHFLPTPEPILSVENNMNLRPRSEMWGYLHELDALSRAAHRQDQLVDSMQAKGFVSSSMTDLAQKINEISEGYITTVNGLPANIQTPIHYVDNQAKQQTIAGLSEYQQKLMDNIYKVTGLTEVMRNVSMEETATQSRYRSKFGSMRLQMKQRLFANYMKQVYAIAAASVCRNFDAETFAAVTSIKLRDQSEISQELQANMMKQQQLRQQIAQLNQQLQMLQQQPGGEGGEDAGGLGPA